MICFMDFMEVEKYKFSFLVGWWRSASPSDSTIFQVFFYISIELSRDGNGIDPWKEGIASDPFGSPTFSWIHHCCLSFKKGCGAQVASIWIVCHVKKGAIFTSFVKELIKRFEDSATFASPNAPKR